MTNEITNETVEAQIKADKYGSVSELMSDRDAPKRIAKIITGKKRAMKADVELVQSYIDAIWAEHIGPEDEDEDETVAIVDEETGEVHDLEDDEEDERPSSIVKDHYKKEYRKHNDSCGDWLANVLAEITEGDWVIKSQLFEVNGVNVEALMHLNPGQRAMTGRNQLTTILLDETHLKVPHHFDENDIPVPDKWRKEVLKKRKIK